MAGIKMFLKKILPLRTSSFLKYKKEINRKIDKSLKQVNGLQKDNAQLKKIIANQNKLLQSIDEQCAGLVNYIQVIDQHWHMSRELEIKINDGVCQTCKNAEAVFKNTINMSKTIDDIVGINREILWSEIFNQTIKGSEWLGSLSFSPGRWAVGYQYLFVLYRILDEVKPKMILDLGLGQSSTLITNYADNTPGVTHTIIEHDETWVKFFQTKYSLSNASKIEMSDLSMVDLSNCSHPVRCYKEFAQITQGKKYDLVSVDGPIGHDMTECARPDVLSLIPDNLADSFVILIDDYERAGEQGMAVRLRELLTQNDIKFTEHCYRGEKKTLLICSADLAFLASL